MNETKLIQEYVSKTQKYKYVSFDLFDTLIFRTFKDPLDVFNAVESIYNSIYDKKVHNFRKIRHNAELKARRKKTNKEITIEEIYEHIKIKDKEILKQLEKSVEIDNCIPNQIMCNVLKQVQTCGKKIIITTDMYLDKDTINKILEKIGLRNSTLFLSSEIGLTKVSGKLFPYIIKNLKIDSGDLIHFGDNPISDIEMANKAGIASYERCVPDLSVVKDGYLHGLDSIARNHISEIYRLTALDDSTEYRIGYTVLGPIIAEFCRWINDIRIEKKADAIFFVAREGYLLKEAYLNIYPHQSNNVNYIRLNKNVMRYPILYINPSVKQLLNTLPMRKIYTAKEILKALYIDVEKSENEHLTKKIPDSMYKTDLLDGKYDSVFEEIFDSLKDKFREQYNYFLKYIKSLGLNGKKILLVNNSMNGNGQFMLETIVDESELNSNIYGVQFVRTRKCKKLLSNRSEGWITDSTVPAYLTMQFDRYVLLLEHLMFEDTGTALYLKKRDDEIIDVICDNQGMEKLNNFHISKIQDAAISFVSFYVKHAPLYLGNQTMECLYNLYAKPYYEDAKMFSNIYDVDMDGTKKLIDVFKWRQCKLVLNDVNAIWINLINIIEILKDVIKSILSKLKSLL